ncbi:hypothetical protein [Pseudomonas indica]|uniref:hypothetical protein n=2 Tax=Pseudomonas indica TaxID=137658 RepID=UPI0023F6C903|nr:hypothetical protein [Pseudomonas indica]MBU3057781.1 hypothetical protein [Pseudomonas indica]
MKTLNIATLGLACLLVASVSEAAVTSFKTKVSQVIPLANGDFVLAFKDANSGCTNPSQNYSVTIGKSAVTAEGSNKMYAAALSAAASGASVEVWFDTAYSACYVSQLKVIF